MVQAVLIVTFVLGVFNAYVALSLRQKLAGFFWASGTLEGLFIAFFLLQLLAPWLDWSRTPIAHSWSGPSYDFLIQSSYLALGVLSCLLIFCLCVDVLWLVVLRWIVPTGWSHAVCAALAFLVLFATGASLADGLRFAGQTKINRVRIHLKTLAPAFDGFTIVQISDLHIGPHLKHAFAQQVVNQVQSLHPDVIVMTGDLADGSAADLAKDVAPLAELTAPFGRYYVTGNHEYYWGSDEWIAQASKLGFRPLLNESVTLERGPSALVIAGVPDLTAYRIDGAVRPNPRLAIKDAPVLATKILLSHQPKLYQDAIDAGYDLQLSGHTHAGQYFPFTKIIQWIEPHTKGLYKEGSLSLYVNKGAGFWGPPLRSGRPGEITLITLIRPD
ncbi:MAG: metallophosphoesterase [Bdellovibrionales bacterium]